MLLVTLILGSYLPALDHELFLTSSIFFFQTVNHSPELECEFKLRVVVYSNNAGTQEKSASVQKDREL